EKVKYPEIYFNDFLIENYFCPEDDCKGQVIEELNNAKHNIYFMTFSFTDDDIAYAILFQNISDIKGIFDKLQAASDYSQYKRMKGFGLNVKLDNSKYKLHHKVFIIDNETVITGSFNPTGAGNFKNDENILIIHDKSLAKEFLEEFNSLW
ncbi:MAG: phospholipase D-like domain-containing protein, partial [archaeon]